MLLLCVCCCCACAVVPPRVKGSTPREVTEADSATRGLLKSHADTPSSPLPTQLTAVPVKRRLTFPSELSVPRKTPAEAPEAAGRLGSSQKKLQVRRVITRRTQRPHRGDACGYWTAWIPICDSFLLWCFVLHAKAGETDCGTAEFSAELHGFRHSDR